ncbi:hypothetical protein V6N13_042700 [Hibiscus sabdariffa]
MVVSGGTRAARVKFQPPKVELRSVWSGRPNALSIGLACNQKSWSSRSSPKPSMSQFLNPISSPNQRPNGPTRANIRDPVQNPKPVQIWRV